MMSDDDDDVELPLNVVGDYYLVNAKQKYVCLSVLPIRFEGDDEAPICDRSVYLRGIADHGALVYKQVVAWKLGLEGRQPEIAVLSTEGRWINLTKPKKSHEEFFRTILITVQMLHFLRRKPEEPEKKMWIHLRKVFDKFDVRPCESDIRDHLSLMKQILEKDSNLAKSQILRAFIEERPRKISSEVIPDNLEKEPFIAADEVTEDMVADGRNESDEEDDDLFDSICAICDNGGDLLGCDGPCMRSFHAKIGTGEDSYCETLGYTEKEVESMKTFLCKNCEHKQHQCFICGVLDSSDGPTAKVFLCNNATCGYFYHPKCVAQRLHPNNKKEASEREKNITDGSSFTCPIHWCFRCEGLEDRTQEHLQFAVCRRCPKSYHRKCLPSEIPFEDSDDEIVTRAWDLSKRILIYCLDHEIDLDIETPVRDHIKFPHIESDCVEKKTKLLAKKKKRAFDDSFPDQRSNRPAKLPDKVRAQENEHARKIAVRSLSEQHVDKPEKKRPKFLKQRTQPELNIAKDASTSSPKFATSPSSTTRKTPWSSFPVVDSETEKRVISLVEKEVSSLTLNDISRKCVVPSTHVYYGRQTDKIVATGRLEQSVQAVGAALKLLDTGGKVNDAKAVCEPEVLKQLAKWHSKLKVYISPFIHGSRYSSFGRHFTKVEKLVEIVDKLHWYVEPGDTIVDFCCGANDFSRLMKEKLDQVQKKCHFKNYDLIQPQNCFFFEKRDWMTVQPKELPHGSQLIMGLNPPFGVKAALANKFIDKALSFKPKLIILIVPKETKRLDQKKTPYDLVWEDSVCLEGRSFYLPGSVDVNDKIVEGWNSSAPPLYLWSHPDWTKKHKKVAEQHNHTAIRKIASLIEESNLSDDVPVKTEAESSNIHNPTSGKEENTGKTSRHQKEANLSGNVPVRRQAEPKSKQKARSGKAKEAREKTVYDVRGVSSEGKAKETREKTASNAREDSPSDDRLVKKQARSGEEKAKEANHLVKKQARPGEGKINEANPPGNYPVKKQDEATFQQIPQSGKQNSRDRYKSPHYRSRKRIPDEVDSLPPEKQVEVAYEERTVIPSKRSNHHEEQRDACCDDGTNAHREECKGGGDSDMIMSSPDPRNARNRSRSIRTDKPSDWTTHPDSYTGYLAEGPHVSTSKSFTYHHEEQRDACCDDGTNAHREECKGGGDSDMIMSSPDPRNARNRSRSYSPCIRTDKPSDWTTHPDSYTGYLAEGPHVSTSKSSTYHGRYLEHTDGFNYALEKKNDPPFYTNADHRSGNYSPSIEELTKRYAAAPAGDAYNLQSQRDGDNFYRMPDDYLQTNRYTLGSSGSSYGQLSLTSPSYGLQGATTSRSSVMDKYAPGLLGLGGPGGSVMDNHASRVLAPNAPGSKNARPLDQTNYITRSILDVPGYGRDMSGNPMSLVSPQYPHRRPGTSGRGPPYI